MTSYWRKNMSEINEEIKIVEIVERLIKQNQDKILNSLQNRLVAIRECSKDFILNPWNLAKSFDVNLIECNELDYKNKTFFKFDDSMHPCIYYNSKLSNDELRFFLMEEIAYYFIIEYIIGYLLPEEYFKDLSNIVLHTVSFDNLSEILESDEFIERTIRDFAFEAMVPSNIFVDFESKKLGVRQMSTYFEVDDRLIDYYLKKDKNIKKRVLK